MHGPRSHRRRHEAYVHGQRTARLHGNPLAIAHGGASSRPPQQLPTAQRRRGASPHLAVDGSHAWRDRLCTRHHARSRPPARPYYNVPQPCERLRPHHRSLTTWCWPLWMPQLQKAVAVKPAATRALPGWTDLARLATGALAAYLVGEMNGAAAAATRLAWSSLVALALQRQHQRLLASHVAEAISPSGEGCHVHLVSRAANVPRAREVHPERWRMRERASQWERREHKHQRASEPLHAPFSLFQPCNF